MAGGGKFKRGPGEDRVDERRSARCTGRGAGRGEWQAREVGVCTGVGGRWVGEANARTRHRHALQKGRGCRGRGRAAAFRVASDSEPEAGRASAVPRSAALRRLRLASQGGCRPCRPCRPPAGWRLAQISALATRESGVSSVPNIIAWWARPPGPATGRTRQHLRGSGGLGGARRARRARLDAPSRWRNEGGGSAGLCSPPGRPAMPTADKSQR